RPLRGGRGAVLLQAMGRDAQGPRRAPARRPDARRRAGAARGGRAARRRAPGGDRRGRGAGGGVQCEPEPEPGRPVRAARSGAASNGWGTGSTSVLSWTRAPSLPTKKLWPSATSRLKTGWTLSDSTAVTVAVPPSVRTVSPGFSSRAMTHPRPATQNRWMPVTTTGSPPPPRRTRRVALGGLWKDVRTGG